jgi:hypothetical protein
MLPGRIVHSIETEHRVMIGEFASAGRTDHFMIVNLSLERSARVKVALAENQLMDVYSPADGSQAPCDPEVWTAAGQGLLFRVRASE